MLTVDQQYDEVLMIWNNIELIRYFYHIWLLKRPIRDMKACFATKKHLPNLDLITNSDRWITHTSSFGNMSRGRKLCHVCFKLSKFGLILISKSNFDALNIKFTLNALNIKYRLNGVLFAQFWFDFPYNFTWNFLKVTNVILFGLIFTSR